MSETRERRCRRSGPSPSTSSKRFRAAGACSSFAEFLELFDGEPVRYSRDASRYLRDVFDHYGTTTVRLPVGRVHALQALRPAVGAAPATPAARGLPRGALIGQENVQEEIYRALSQLRARGAAQPARPPARPERLGQVAPSRVHHGGARALLDARRGRALPLPLGLPVAEDGARLARVRARQARRATAATSYAHLADDEIDAKLLVEVRDHPLFLIPLARARSALLEAGLQAAPAAAEPPNDWILRGQLSHKSQQVFEALLSSYRRLVHRGAEARAGRALLHLAPLPHRAP